PTPTAAPEPTATSEPTRTPTPQPTATPLPPRIVVVTSTPMPTPTPTSTLAPGEPTTTEAAESGGGIPPLLGLIIVLIGLGIILSVASYIRTKR
ncbi:MAG: hypothetical protein OXK21_08695, partial [Chloroflexota bacterium]|nr:hypothetical protein [Chloroflexota bacterium]